MTIKIDSETLGQIMDLVKTDEFKGVFDDLAKLSPEQLVVLSRELLRNAGKPSSIDHDEEWLSGRIGSGYRPSEAGPVSTLQIAEEYLEHMSRWHGMTEVPEIGQRVEVAYRCKADWLDDWSSVENFAGGFTTCPYSDDGYDDMIGHVFAWRPVSGLPS